MSGGSYDYFYQRVERIADDLTEGHETPQRLAFAAHLRLVAKALHDIEWVDSCDYGRGDENQAILACLLPAATVDQARRDALRYAEALVTVLRSAGQLPVHAPIDATFMECDACRAKPGSPRLCASCLHNRRVIEELGELTR